MSKLGSEKILKVYPYPHLKIQRECNVVADLYHRKSIVLKIVTKFSHKTSLFGLTPLPLSLFVTIFLDSPPPPRPVTYFITDLFNHAPSFVNFDL